MGTGKLLSRGSNRRAFLDYWLPGVIWLVAAIILLGLFLPKLRAYHRLQSEYQRLQKDVAFWQETWERLVKRKDWYTQLESEIRRLESQFKGPESEVQLVHWISPQRQFPGLRILSFKKKPGQVHGILEEIPITIKLRGPFWEIGRYLQQFDGSYPVLYIEKLIITPAFEGRSQVIAELEGKLWRLGPKEQKEP